MIILYQHKTYLAMHRMYKNLSTLQHILIYVQITKYSYPVIIKL